MMIYKFGIFASKSKHNKDNLARKQVYTNPGDNWTVLANIKFEFYKQIIAYGKK